MFMLTLNYRKAEDDYNFDDYQSNDDPINPESLIGYGKLNRPKLLICITIYNEPPRQMLESIAGIYRAYYELGKPTTLR